MVLPGRVCFLRPLKVSHARASILGQSCALETLKYANADTMFMPRCREPMSRLVPCAGTMVAPCKVSQLVQPREGQT